MSTEIQNVQSPAVVEAEPKKLEGEALKEAILRQVDYYFSRQNLSNDAYLVSQMRKDAKGMYVALKTIAAFTKVKNLSEDLQLITEVMKTSKSVAVDESNGDSILRPTHLNATRNTLMLRDIPSSTDQEIIKQIFVNEKSAVPLSLQSAIGDNWFITFDSEADAVKALEFIRTQTFNGKKMSGCLKSENLLKSSTFPVKNGDAPAETSTGPIFQAQGMPYPQQRWNRNPPMPQPYTAPSFEFYDSTYRQNKNRPYSANPRRGGASGAPQPRRKDGSPTYHKRGQYQAANGATPQQLATPQTTPTAEQTPIASPAQPVYNARQPKHSATQPAEAQNASKKSPTPGAEKKRRGSKGQGRQAMPNLTATDFPPLPSVGKDENKTGYETTFKRYTKQEIIEVVSTLGSGITPSELPADVPAVLPTANSELELLKPLPKSDKGEEKVEQPAVKSFAEAAITAKDIKTPEHKDGRTRRNSKRSENVITASTATNSKRSGKATQPESADASAESTPAPTTATEEEFKEVKHNKRNRKNVPQVQQPQTASSPVEGESTTADATDATVDAILKKKAQKNNRQRRNNAEQAAEQSQDHDSKKATTYADIVAAKKAAAEKSKQEAAAAAAAEKATTAPTDAVSPPGK